MMATFRHFTGPVASHHIAEPVSGGGWYMSVGKHRYAYWTDVDLQQAIDDGRLLEWKAAS